jgi:hypothetical protein
VITLATKDYTDFRDTLLDEPEIVYYDPYEWSDEFQGCPQYREYCEEWT